MYAEDAVEAREDAAVCSCRCICCRLQVRAASIPYLQRRGVSGCPTLESTGPVVLLLRALSVIRPVLGHLCTKGRFDSGFGVYARGATARDRRERRGRRLLGW
jgi:hypothetical protein